MRNTSTNVLIIVIVANILIYVGYAFLFYQIRSDNETSSHLANTLDLGEQKNSRITALRSIVADTADNRAKLGAFFVTPDSVVPFVEQIESLGKSTGITAHIVTLGNVDASGHLTVNLSTTGSWSDTLYFAKLLENLPYDIRMADVKLDANGSSQDSKKSGSSVPTWNGTFMLVVAETT